MRHAYSYFLCLVTIAAACSETSQTPKNDNNNPTEERTGSIQGLVVMQTDSTRSLQVSRATNGTAVPGATCTLTNTNFSTTTDDQGFFNFLGVPEGSYILVCKKQLDGNKTFAFLTVVAVKSGQVTDVQTIELKSTGSLQGQVRLADKTKQPGILVYIPGTSYQARSSEEGSYTITDVPEGAYTLRFEYAGYESQEIKAVQILSGQSTPIPFVELSIADGFYTLTTNSLGTGTVTSNPSGINCGSDCQEVYAENSIITLTAVPGKLTSFGGWTGICTSFSGTTCTISLTKDQSISAIFTANPSARLTVQKEGTGSGKIYTPAYYLNNDYNNPITTIDCGEDCEEVYPLNEYEKIYVISDPDSYFGSWTGDCNFTGWDGYYGSESYCTLKMNQDKLIVANFVQITVSDATTLALEGSNAKTFYDVLDLTVDNSEGLAKKYWSSPQAAFSISCLLTQTSVESYQCTATLRYVDDPKKCSEKGVELKPDQSFLAKFSGGYECPDVLKWVRDFSKILKVEETAGTTSYKRLTVGRLEIVVEHHITGGDYILTVTISP